MFSKKEFVEDALVNNGFELESSFGRRTSTAEISYEEYCRMMEIEPNPVAVAQNVKIIVNIDSDGEYYSEFDYESGDKDDEVEAFLDSIEADVEKEIDLIVDDAIKYARYC